MSETGLQQEPLRVGQVMADATNVVRAGAGPLFLVIFVTIVISTVLNAVLSGTAEAMLAALSGQSNAGRMLPTSGAMVFLATIVSAAITIFGYATATLIAYNVGHGHPAGVRSALGRAVRLFPLTFVMSVVFVITFVLGWLFLAVPGLWVLGLWGPLLPVIMIEQRGFGALSRTRKLTKGYRWPVVGAFLLAGFLAMLIGMIVAAALGVVALMIGSMGFIGVSAVFGLIVTTITSGMVTVFLVAFMASIYKRLLTIKEGGSGPDVAHVFD